MINLYWFRTCLNIIFLNSQFNASRALSDHLSYHLDECIGYLEVGSNEGRMPKLVLFHGIFFLHLCLRAPSLNNAVYVISLSQALITMARSEKIVFSYRFLVSSPPPKSLHHSVNLNFDWSTIKWSTEKTQLESHHYPSNLNFAHAVNCVPKFI